MWREHMFIYAACLRRNFNYCSKLSLQLILFQDFIEKEWKDNGRDKCTGPGAPADIGRGKLLNCIFALDDVKNQGEDSYKMHHFRLHDNHNGVQQQHLSR